MEFDRKQSEILFYTIPRSPTKTCKIRGNSESPLLFIKFILNSLLLTVGRWQERTRVQVFCSNHLSARWKSMSSCCRLDAFEWKNTIFKCILVFCTSLIASISWNLFCLFLFVCVTILCCCLTGSGIKILRLGFTHYFQWCGLYLSFGDFAVLSCFLGLFNLIAAFLPCLSSGACFG